MKSDTKTEVAVFGSGCFWCTEAVFQSLEGVLSVSSGYAGGAKGDPTYEDVSSGTTGHAEVIQIEFDPAKISYDDLLAVFFFSHDPTTLNRQGNDGGKQYRSVIFYTNESQKKAAQMLIGELHEKKAYEKDVVTEVKPLDRFYPAESYHKDYYKRNSSAPYCELVIAPKLEKLEKRFSNLMRKQS